MKVLTVAVVLAWIVTGCEHPRAGRTTLPSYVAAQNHAITGKEFMFPMRQELSDLEWEKWEDSGGVKIIVKGNHFEVIDAMFREALGTPYELTTNELGYPSVTYHVRQHGVLVTYEVRDDIRHYPKSVWILLLKPIRY